jgi:hypothetical protein
LKSLIAEILADFKGEKKVKESKEMDKATMLHRYNIGGYNGRRKTTGSLTKRFSAAEL